MSANRPTDGEWRAIEAHHLRTIEALRRNFARYLAPLYREDDVEIARLCDEELDQSGALLGYVRDAARNRANLGAKSDE
jgi:hypothetical protein